MSCSSLGLHRGSIREAVDAPALLVTAFPRCTSPYPSAAERPGKHLRRLQPHSCGRDERRSLYGFGQLGAILRARFCDAKIQGINKTDGLTWKVKEILERAKHNVTASLSNHRSKRSSKIQQNKYMNHSA